MLAVAEFFVEPCPQIRLDDHRDRQKYTFGSVHARCKCRWRKDWGLAPAVAATSTAVRGRVQYAGRVGRRGERSEYLMLWAQSFLSALTHRHGAVVLAFSAIQIRTTSPMKTRRKE